MAINPRRSPTLLAIGLLAILYFVVGSFCLRLAFLNASASPVWPTAGIALAALLLLGHRVWPGVLIGAFLVNITTTGNAGTSLFIAVGNTLEAVCGVWLVNRFAERETATGFFILCIVAIWGTLRHRGPFIMETENQSLLMLQSSTAVLFITAMALAAAMAERRRAEEALASQKAAVEAANKTKDYFLAMLSHELRTPLTPVLAELDVLEFDGGSAKDSKAALATIRRNVELESQLIDDLLDLTRITRDKLQLTLVPHDAHQAISNVVEICREELSTRKLKLELNLRAEAHHISADAAKFQQIAWNLLKNAIKFTGEEGEITISTANPSPHTLAITVRDTGVGIDRDLLDRIFEPFEQGAQSFQKRLGGLGLGLAIS